jgi:hypothetical protein
MSFKGFADEKKHHMRKNERDVFTLYLLLVAVNNIFIKYMAPIEYIRYKTF